MPMVFAPELKVVDLLVCHPDYNAKQIRLYESLYEGGERARSEEVQNEMLIMRQVEKIPQFKGQYARRKERAHYVNRIGGLVDWFVASVFPEGPNIESQGQFWKDLDEDADGLGTPFSTLNRSLLRGMLVNKRVYVKVWFPVKTGEEVRADDDATLAPHLSVVCAEEADDWEYTRMGNLSCLRLHTQEIIREKENDPTSPWGLERHRWKFFTENVEVTYTATKKIGEDWPTDEVAKREAKTEDTEHDFGVLPLFDLRSAPGHWVVDRIFDVAKAIYNREAAITWALDMQAYALAVANVNSNKNLEVYGSELCALRLDIGESFGFVAPPPAIFDPLFKDAERLTGDLYEVIQALAINAAAIPQAGRLSGEAVMQLRAPVSALLNSFSQPVKECMARAVKAIQEYRGEESLKVELTGYEVPLSMEELTVEDMREDIEPMDPKNRKKKEERANGEKGE